MVKPQGQSSRYCENMYFSNKKITYVWNVELGNFEKQPHIDDNMTQAQFHKCKEGLGQLTVTDRLQEYGENMIKISVPGVVFLVFHEVCPIRISTNIHKNFSNNMKSSMQYNICMINFRR